MVARKSSRRTPSVVELSYSDFYELGFNNFSTEEKIYTRILAFTAGLRCSTLFAEFIMDEVARIKEIELPLLHYYHYGERFSRSHELATRLESKYHLPAFTTELPECKELVSKLISPLIKDGDFKKALENIGSNPYYEPNSILSQDRYIYLYKLAFLSNDDLLIENIEWFYNSQNCTTLLIMAAQTAVLSIYKTCQIDNQWVESRTPVIRNIVFNLAVHQAIAYGYYDNKVLSLIARAPTFMSPFAEFNGPLVYQALNEDENAALTYIQSEKSGQKKIKKQFVTAIKIALAVLYRKDDELQQLIDQIGKIFTKGADVTEKYDIGCRVLETLVYIGIILKGSHSEKLFLQIDKGFNYSKQQPFFIAVGDGDGGLQMVRIHNELGLSDKKTAMEYIKTQNSVHVADDNFFDMMFVVATKMRLKVEDKDCLNILTGLYHQLEHLSLFQKLCGNLIQEFPGISEQTSTKYKSNQSLINLSSLIREVPEWQKKIDNLAEIFDFKNDKEKFLSKEQRTEKKVIWVVNSSFTFRAYEMKSLVSGQISKGKTISLQKLVDETSSFDYLSDSDQRVVSQLKSVRAKDLANASSRSYFKPPKMLTAHGIPFSQVVESCLGIDNLYLEADNSKEITKIQVVKKPLKCSIAESKDKLFLSLDEEIEEHFQDFLHVGSLIEPEFFKITDHNVIEWYHLGEKEIMAHELIGDGFSIPKKEIGKILQFFSGSNPILSVDYDFGSTAVKADPTIVIQMEQKEDFFTGYIGVKPFGYSRTPFYQVATGVSTPIINVPSSVLEESAKKALSEKTGSAGSDSHQMVTLKCQRDFNKEKEYLDNLLTRCPTLADNYDEGYISIENIESLLNTLEELESSGVKYHLEWARGNSIKVSKTIDTTSVHLKITKSKKAAEWFNVDGHLSIEKDKEIPIQLLLDSLKGSRFVSVGNGEFIALTEKLRKKLASLKMVATIEKNKSIQINSLAAGAVEQSLEDIDIKADPVWQSSVERMKKAFASTPKVPATLQAQLRDYQIEGYEWIQRLAIWGVGACLADDMGLGKTVQTIAVLLNQAKKGPCLVLAPTSVGSNWKIELRKFAPSLNIHQFENRNREELVNSLGKNDVLIVGYGLLSNVEKYLTSLNWSMVVFDEAQALKNFETKRAKAGKNIQADFRLALTGTPIENRIEDLWSLFNNINPGLLGSWTAFHERFKNTDPGSADNKALKKIVKPFLLRRLKSSVLDELPSRTEQNIMVEMSDKEKVFYNNLRSSLLEGLENAPANNKKFLILAGLTKLRRACCHPVLADNDMAQLEDRSSKIEKFIELVKELAAGGHKVLAFSQFTSFLSLIEKALNEEHIDYKYLDGSTPEEERAKRIAQFQAGEGDVFLLSLKAGGSGINLTAADYVIHLDPWWNPAVEDQASDRAHRLGQKRPVTIYRLVSEHTVEEKILKLHAEKRELAADFLDGTSSVVKHMTEEDLLSLMQS